MEKGDIKKQPDKKQLEQLATVLNLLQTDFDEVPVQERTDIFKDASVLDERYGLVALVSQGVAKEFGLKTQEIAKAARELWDKLQKQILSLREFFFWLYDDLELGIEIRVLPEPRIFRRIKTKTGDEAFELKQEKYGGISIPVNVIDPKKSYIENDELKLEILKTFRLPMEYIRLLELLDGVTTQLKRCERDSCGKIFVQTTKREKRFCSTKCQSHMSVMAMRERQNKKGGA